MSGSSGIAAGVRSVPRAVWIAVVAVIAIVAAVIIGGTIVNNLRYNTYTAYFKATSGMFVGDPVKIIGVEVGKVSSITPRSGDVKVRFTVDSSRKLPKNASAYIVADSLVGGRFIQVTPVYHGGDTLGDGGQIPMERTAIPVEWDQVKSELDKLADNLGPKDDDEKGSLARTVNTLGRNLDGTGADLNRALKDLSRVSTTLADNRGDLFATVRNLQTLTTALSSVDDQMMEFNGRIASVSKLLAGNTGRLDGALKEVDSVLGEVSSFLDTNTGALSTSVERLSDVTTTIKQKDEQIRGLLHSGPHQLVNFYNIYNPLTGSLTGAFALGNGGSLINFLCQAIEGSDFKGNPVQADAAECVDVLGPMLASIAVNYPPFLLNPMTGMSATQDQLIYQNEDVKRRAQARQDDIDAGNRKENPGKDTNSLTSLLVPFGGK
ncbi:MCE family protein [Gordonia amarae]|uniref:MCE family protein n=1 Tax=Gordonia amarae TaxID=36821 RepID=UPI001AF8290C|nr:MCE family protein [Gordonia amarae]QHN32438.1 MCE family protein [Gordonia amarae]